VLCRVLSAVTVSRTHLSLPHVNERMGKSMKNKSLTCECSFTSLEYLSPSVPSLLSVFPLSLSLSLSLSSPHPCVSVSVTLSCLHNKLQSSTKLTLLSPLIFTAKKYIYKIGRAHV